MELSFEVIALLFAAAGIAGFVDAAAGGRGLITIPVLMLSGMSPTQALGTNKFQACFGSFSASFHFIREGFVKPLKFKLAVTVVALSAALGGYLAQQINSQQLLTFLPVVFICIALYTLFAKNLGEEEGQTKISQTLYASTIAPTIGFYDGFAGAGKGTFFALSFIKLRGISFVRATAHAKVLNFTSNFFSLLLFIGGGQIVWLAGLCMGVGQMFGAYLGAKIAIKKGAGFIRAITVISCLAMSISLLFNA